MVSAISFSGSWPCHSRSKAVCRLRANAEHPYPSNEQKQNWANSGKITRHQINYFLINNRKRRTYATNATEMQVGASMLGRIRSYDSALNGSGSALSFAGDASTLERIRPYDSALSSTIWSYESDLLSSATTPMCTPPPSPRYGSGSANPVIRVRPKERTTPPSSPCAGGTTSERLGTSESELSSAPTPPSPP